MKNAIWRIIDHLNHTRLASPATWNFQIVQTEVADARGVDQRNEVGEVVGHFSICGTSEGPLTDRVNVLDRDGEFVDLNGRSTAVDDWYEAAAGILRLFILIEASIWWPEQDEVSRGQANKEQR